MTELKKNYEAAMETIKSVEAQLYFMVESVDGLNKNRGALPLQDSVPQYTRGLGSVLWAIQDEATEAVQALEILGRQLDFNQSSDELDLGE